MNLFKKYQDVISTAAEDSYFAKCGFAVCENSDEVKGNTLIVGINPSKPESVPAVRDFSYPNPFVPKPIRYFSNLCKFIPEEERKITGYLDLLPFSEKSQKYFLSQIRGNEAFVSRVMAVTQGEIERINPALIILANKSVRPFFGAALDCVWMGYDFATMTEVEKDIQLSMQGKNFDVRIIKGFRQDQKAKDEIIYRPADGICRLKGTVVLFYEHIRGLSRDEKLTEPDYKALSAYAKKVKSKYIGR